MSSPSHTSSANPNQSTSSPALNSTEPPFPVLPPNQPPTVRLGDDGANYYVNTTIDDFSPLMTFSDGWISTIADMNSSNPLKPIPQRNWHLWTYKRTETPNATVSIEFWGSELYLYGDTGPAYGVYSLALDDETPTVHTAFYPALAAGRSHLMHTLRNLTEGRHELTITNLGTRDGLNEGPAFLLDFAVARQKVGTIEGLQPNASDVRDEALSGLATNGTWSLLNIQDDVVPGEGGLKPAIYVERRALFTTDDWATLVHRFQGTGIQVFGGWNSTHGSYRATLTDTGNSTVLHSKIYDTAAVCGGSDAPGCEWRGTTLKFTAADLNPDAQYELTLQNVHSGGNSAFEVGFIRVFGSQDAREPGTGSSGVPAPSTGGGLPEPGSAGQQPGGASDETGSGRMNSLDPLLQLWVLMFLFVAAWKTLKH
ncbi:hypothetical protein CC2G_002008 [Coprinopsis cinerea AmutBmut pab1-1]|nr:hypothetical protein CC2G_002008 [Coprinopsis cinerea AmutBmut pab1-1]